MILYIVARSNNLKLCDKYVGVFVLILVVTNAYDGNV